MDFQAFTLLKKKPNGMTCSDSPLNSQFALNFDDVSLELLDDYSSFEDLMSGIGIETSWCEDFAKVFPTFQPLACVDMDSVENFDSYGEFMLLVDTSSPQCSVYWFSAESWRWADWRKSKNGFTLLAESFAEFYESLQDYEKED